MQSQVQKIKNPWIIEDGAPSSQFKATGQQTSFHTEEAINLLMKGLQ